MAAAEIKDNVFWVGLCTEQMSALEKLTEHIPYPCFHVPRDIDASQCLIVTDCTPEDRPRYDRFRDSSPRMRSVSCRASLQY